MFSPHCGFDPGGIASLDKLPSVCGNDSDKRGSLRSADGSVFCCGACTVAPLMNRCPAYLLLCLMAAERKQEVGQSCCKMANVEIAACRCVSFRGNTIRRRQIARDSPERLADLR